MEISWDVLLCLLLKLPKFSYTASVSLKSNDVSSNEMDNATLSNPTSTLSAIVLPEEMELIKVTIGGSGENCTLNRNGPSLEITVLLPDHSFEKKRNWKRKFT